MLFSLALVGEHLAVAAWPPGATGRSSENREVIFEQFLDARWSITPSSLPPKHLVQRVLSNPDATFDERKSHRGPEKYSSLAEATKNTC